MRHLRDHYESGMVHTPGRLESDPQGWSVCMHPGPGVAATAASLIAELPADPAIPMTLWCSMGTPCTTVFIPIPFGGELPDCLTKGTGQFDPASLWWAMKAVGDTVMEDPVRLTPIVQAHWGPWEAELLAAWAADRAGIAPRVAELVAEIFRRLPALRVELDRARKQRTLSARGVA